MSRHIMQFYDAEYYDTDTEFQELWDLLIESYTLTASPDNWLFDRLEDWKYGSNAQRAAQNPSFFSQHAHVWRDTAGRLIGFCIAEYGDDSMFLQIHPQHRRIEGAMLEWAETTWGSGKASLATYAYTHDTLRRQLLVYRGYSDAGECGRTYTFDLARRYPAPLPAGYRIASLAEDRNVESHIATVASAFGRATLDRAWFESKITAPTYLPSWDLAVLSPEGEHVAFCLARLDEYNRVASIDPIGTRPDYQRRGLAKALVSECFRRLGACGMRYAYIGAGPKSAVGNRLYESLGAVELYKEHSWIKKLP